ncbi:MAG: hypothetical protein R3C03_18530 [Pirellulaceae bacterium]
MPRRRRQTNGSSSENQDIQNQSQERRQRNAERKAGATFVRRLGILFIVLTFIVALLPNIVAWTPLKQYALDYALQDLNGRVTVEGMSLGWFQAIRINGLKLQAEDGTELAQVETIQSSKRLFQLLTQDDYGSIEVLRPSLQLVTRDGGSNIEDAIQKFMEAPETDEPNSPLPPVTIKVIDGTVALSSQQSPNPWKLEHLNVDVAVANQAALIGHLDSTVARDEQFGNLNVDFVVDDQQQELLLQNARATIQAESLALGCLTPVLERVLAGNSIDGTLDGQVVVGYSNNGNQANIDFQNTRLENIAVSSPQYLGADRVQLNSVVAAGNLTVSDQGANANEFDIKSDVGRVVTNGEFNWNQFAKLASETVLVNTPFQLDGQIDLARLTQMLPQTFQLYNDLRVESGTIRCQINSRPEQDAGRLMVNVDSANFVAVRNGQRLAWQQPLRLVSIITQRNREFFLEELKCESDFLTINGHANQKTGHFTAKGDLAVLMQRLSQFVDLGEFNVQGTIDGEMDWRAAQGIDPAQLSLVNVPLEFSGDFRIDQPTVALPGMKPWHESELKATIAGTATALASGSASIESADGQVIIGRERARLLLQQPIQDIAASQEFQARCIVIGGLERWLAHAGTFYDLSFLNTDGQVRLESLLGFDGNRLNFEQLKYQIEQWVFDGYGMKINEPMVNGEGQMAFDLTSGELTFPDITVVSSGVAARGENVTISYHDFLETKGLVAFRADAHRVLEWLSLFSQPDDVQFFGLAEGNIELASNADWIQGRLTGKLGDFVAAQQTTTTDAGVPQWSELLRESAVQFGGGLAFRQDFDSLQFDKFQVSAPSISAVASGSIEDLAGQLQCNLQGTWSPDWNRVQSLLDAYAYNQVKLAGQTQQQFSVQGPMFGTNPNAAWPPSELKVISQVGWEQGNVFMLPVGAANVTAGLVDGYAVLDTGEIPFSGGTVSAHPAMLLSDQAQTVTLESGPLLTSINLTPEICRDWMKYVAPLVADVTSAEGKLSVQTQDVSVPITNLNAATGRGSVTLNDVTLGAGPLGKELISTVESLRMILKPNASPDTKDRSVWLRLEEQTVPIAVSNGRVHHDQMKIRVKDVTMTTKGSVGFDQTISMTAEIPILDDWISGEKYLEVLKGETIKIPITGTLSKPKLDVRAMQELSMQIVQKTAANQLNQQTEKLQNKLGNEVQKVPEKLVSEFEKVQNKFNEKVQGDVFKGLNNLFGPKKDN